MRPHGEREKLSDSSYRSLMALKKSLCDGMCRVIKMEIYQFKWENLKIIGGV